MMFAALILHTTELNLENRGAPRRLNGQRKQTEVAPSSGSELYVTSINRP
jgi:hypothetical protein